MLSSQKLHYSFKHEELTARLQEIANKIAAANDDENTKRIHDLIEKLNKQEIIIAFCGHFSSGKSSIINKLIGSDILPTSPVPKKSNIVKLYRGKPKAKIFLKNNSIQEFSFEDDILELQKYCLDLNNVETLEISYDIKDDKISNLSLLDTPGVDTFEEAKNIAADTSIYLADAIIYVMDYNHVQSEVNFNFTKLFKDIGKPVYLVINQIDKHCDFEIDFEFFKESVVTAFDSWNIKPEGIYFTSLLDEAHPENQLRELIDKISEFVSNKESIVIKSTVDAAIAIIKAHISKYEESLSTKKEEYLAILQETDITNVHEKLNNVIIQISELENKLQTFETEIRKEAFNLLESARLTPYSTTELARNYLESRKEGFKIGFLFTAKKTNEEIKKRLLALHKDFTEKINANLDWHLKELLRKIPEKYGYITEEYLKQLYSLNIEVTPQLLEATVKTTSIGNREYAINYCKDISAEVITQYRKKVNELIQYLLDLAENRISSLIKDLQNKKAEYEKIIYAEKQLSNLKQQTKIYHDSLQTILLGRTA